MTTIATDGKSMAGDSLITGGGQIVGYMDKVIKLDDGRIVGCCGLASDVMNFRAWLVGAIEKPSLEKDGFSALVLMPSGIVYHYHADLTPIEYIAPMAIGSGGDFALGAMLAGKTPGEAVEIAICRDTRSGGKVTELSI